MIGRTLKHYKIVGQLGKGGMGEVYVAEDSKLGRKVAVKILPAALAADAERRTRFEREAKAVAALNHPNIITVYSVEHDGDVHFITMELVEGATLSGLLFEGKGLPLEKLLDYAIEMTDAMTGAHRKGITHRDLKPDNVMIGEDGRIKVLDFGLAKVGDGGGSTGGETVLPTQTVTQEGKILGTVAYMAPEQAEGKPVDARSDVFSLGVILYQMATGARPFQGDTSISTISSILRDQPRSITQLNRSLPRHLARIVNRCLEKDPERRYQNAQDLRNDLQGLRDELSSGDLQASDVAVAPRPAAAASRWPVIAMGLVAVVAIAFAVVQLRGRGTGPDPAAPAAVQPTMEITRLTASGRSGEATISADGRHLVYLIDDAGRTGMWVTQVATGSKVEIVPPSDAQLWDPTFSPDGDFIYFVRRVAPDLPDLYRVPALGGNPRKIMSDVHGRVSFSPDGKQFVFLRRNPENEDTLLVVAGIDGSNPRVVATTHAPSSFDDPVWSPEGRMLAVARQSFAGGIKATVGTLPVEGGEWTPLGERTWLGVDEISWLPGGAGLVITASDAMTTQLWEVGYPQGRVRRITNDLNTYDGASLTADGTTLATVLNESRFNLWTVGTTRGAQPVQVTSARKANDGNGLDWTPDGRIVYGTDAGGGLDIWISDADGSNATRLTTQALNVGPQVSPDGRHVVFMSTRAQTVNLWRMDIDGGNPVQLTFGALDVAPDISPDGKWIVYLEPGSGKILRIPFEGGEPIVVREKRSGDASVSPDGQRILTSSFHPENQRWQVDVIPFEGGEPIHTLFEKDTGGYRWCPDGSLSYKKTDGDVENIWKRSPEGGDAVQLTRFDKDFIRGYAWSPDGQRILVSRGRNDSDIVLLRNFR